MSGTSSSKRAATLAALGEGLAGAAGSVASILALYPLDTTRTIIQVRTPPYDTVDMPFLKLMVHIGKTEGWKRLYRGLTSAIVGSGLSWALYFGWHEGFKRWILSLRKGRKRLTAADEMLAAAMAGVLTTLIVNPIWVINTRMKVAAKKRLAAKTDVVVPGAAVVVAGGQNGAAVNGGVSNGNGHTNGVGVGKGASEAADGDSGSGKTTNFMELIRKEGLMGWLTGIVPSLLLLINPAIQLLVYARLRRMVQKRFGRAPGASEAAVMGAVAKFFAVLLTYPAQTVKLRMQAGLKASQLGGKGGVNDMWRGVWNKMITSVLHSAVMFSTVEMFRTMNKAVAAASKAKRQIRN